MFSPVSILVVTVLSSILSILVLSSLVSHAVPGVRHWIWGNVIAIVSLALFAMQGALPAILGIVAANQLLAATILMMFEGCTEFFAGRVNEEGRRAGWVAWLAVMAGIAWFTYVAPDAHTRVVIVSAFHAACDLAIAVTIVRSRPVERPRYSYWFAAGAASLGCIGHVVRGSIYAVKPPAQTALLQPGTMQIAFLALGILVLPSLCIGMVMMAHDRLAQRLERLVRFDDLTGVLSRKALFELAEARLARPGAQGMQEHVVVVDVDHFKSVNDRFGHAAGDAVLRHFASLVNAHLREGDAFGRIGGEAFCMLCSARGTDEVGAFVESLRRMVEATPCEVASRPLRYTFSAGVARWNGSEPLASLIARADALLYAAKLGGRNRVETSVLDEIS
jgi:diguanylate cyclase (GGDEF)-like protein